MAKGSNKNVYSSAKKERLALIHPCELCLDGKLIRKKDLAAHIRYQHPEAAVCPKCSRIYDPFRLEENAEHPCPTVTCLNCSEIRTENPNVVHVCFGDNRDLNDRNKKKKEKKNKLKRERDRY